jgi:hypothetical protein
MVLAAGTFFWLARALLALSSFAALHGLAILKHLTGAEISRRFSYLAEVAATERRAG